MAKPGLDTWFPYSSLAHGDTHTSWHASSQTLMRKNENNWLETFTHCACASVGSRESLNDGFVEGLRLVPEPELQRAGAVEEARIVFPGKMQEGEGASLLTLLSMARVPKVLEWKRGLAMPHSERLDDGRQRFKPNSVPILLSQLPLGLFVPHLRS